MCLYCVETIEDYQQLLLSLPFTHSTLFYRLDTTRTNTILMRSINSVNAVRKHTAMISHQLKDQKTYPSSHTTC